MEKESTLTPGERRVFEGILRGETNKEIAVQLACSVKNVEYHVSKILRKLGLPSRTRLLAAAAQSGLGQT